MGREAPPSPNPTSRGHPAPWHGVDRSARPQKSGTSVLGAATPSHEPWGPGRCARPLRAWYWSLEASVLRMATPLPSPRPSPGPPPRTAARGRPRAGRGPPGSSSGPQHPGASRLPCASAQAYPSLLAAGHSPVSGSGPEGRGLPAPSSPRAQSSASRMAAAPREGRGQQVLGRAPRRGGGRVCLAPCRSAMPRGPAPPRPRARPRLLEAPPPVRPRPRRVQSLRGAGGLPLRSLCPAPALPGCCAGWEPRPGPSGLGVASPPGRGSGPLSSSFAALPPLVRRPALQPVLPTAGRAARGSPAAPAPDPCEARAAGGYAAFY